VLAVCLKDWFPPSVDGVDSDAAIFVVADTILHVLQSLKKK
jgi:hypothetical protein